MSDLESDLRSAFDGTDYDVAELSVNRRRVRVAVLQEGADPEALRAVVDEAVGDEDVFGLSVTTETIGGDDEVGTVVTFQRRP